MVGTGTASNSFQKEIACLGCSVCARARVSSRTKQSSLSFQILLLQGLTGFLFPASPGLERHLQRAQLKESAKRSGHRCNLRKRRRRKGVETWDDHHGGITRGVPHNKDEKKKRKKKKNHQIGAVRRLPRSTAAAGVRNLPGRAVGITKTVTRPAISLAGWGMRQQSACLTALPRVPLGHPFRTHQHLAAWLSCQGPKIQRLR